MYRKQLFAAEAVQGRKLIYLYRRYSRGTEVEGKTLAFTTENNRSVSKDAESTATKDGTIRTPGAAEVEITVTSILTAGDPKIDEYEDAFIAGELFEVWEANLTEPAGVENQFKGIYYQGYMSSFSKSSNADGYVEISCTFGLNGSGARGNVTVSVEEQEAAAYVFSDTVKRFALSVYETTVTKGGSVTITYSQAVDAVTAVCTGAGLSATVDSADHEITIAASSSAVDGYAEISDTVTTYRVPITVGA